MSKPKTKSDLSEFDLELSKEIGGFAHDPYGYVMFNFPWGVKGTSLEKKKGPREWQVKILKSIGDKLKAGAADLGEVIKEAVASGHGVGKSALVSWLVKWAHDTCVDNRAVVTANTEAQLRTKTWPELSKWHNLSLTKNWSTLTATALISNMPGHDLTWRTDAVTWSKTNTEAFAGLHNEGKRILLIFDEASAIIDLVWEVAEGALTDEFTEIIWCVFGNPTRNSGRFKSCFNGQGTWNVHRVDSRTVEGVNLKQIAQWIKEYGEDSDFVRVRVRGTFPRAGSLQFISSEDVLASVKRKPGAFEDKGRVMAVDIARHGDDESVICMRQGRKVFPFKRLRIANLMQLAARIAQEIDDFQPDMCFIDATGMGWGVVDRLNQLGYKKVIGVQVGEAANDPSRFKLKREELWYWMREFIQDGGCLPDDPVLEQELTVPEYGFDDKQRYILESKKDMKKRGEKSPDAADSLALSFFAPVAPTAFQKQTWRKRLKNKAQYRSTLVA